MAAFDASLRQADIPATSLSGERQTTLTESDLMGPQRSRWLALSTARPSVRMPPTWSSGRCQRADEGRNMPTD